MRLAEQWVRSRAIGTDQCIARVRTAGRKRSQIELVEDVVEVAAKLEPGIFAEDGQLRKAERFLNSGVGIEILRSTKEVPADLGRGRRSGRVWECTRDGEGGKVK